MERLQYSPGAANFQPIGSYQAFRKPIPRKIQRLFEELAKERVGQQAGGQYPNIDDPRNWDEEGYRDELQALMDNYYGLGPKEQNAMLLQGREQMGKNYFGPEEFKQFQESLTPIRPTKYKPLSVPQTQDQAEALIGRGEFQGKPIEFARGAGSSRALAGFGVESLPGGEPARIEPFAGPALPGQGDLGSIGGLESQIADVSRRREEIKAGAADREAERLRRQKGEDIRQAAGTPPTYIDGQITGRVPEKGPSAAAKKAAAKASTAKDTTEYLLGEYYKAVIAGELDPREEVLKESGITKSEYDTIRFDKVAKRIALDWDIEGEEGKMKPFSHYRSVVAPAGGPGRELAAEESFRQAMTKPGMTEQDIRNANDDDIEDEVIRMLKAQKYRFGKSVTPIANNENP